MKKTELLKLGIKGAEFLSPRVKADIEAPIFINKTSFTVKTFFTIGAYTLFRGGSVSSLQSAGRFCSIAPDVSIGDGEHPTQLLSTHHFQYGGKLFDFYEPFRHEKSNLKLTDSDVITKSPVIGNDVWVGRGAFIRRGVRIGNGAIIAAGSVVVKDVAPYEIVGGVPAKRIRFRFADRIIEKLETLCWWNFTLESLKGLDFKNIESCVNELEERSRKGLLIPAEYKTIEIRPTP